MCTHDLLAGVDLDGREVILPCDECDREAELDAEDQWDREHPELSREDRPHGWH